ncbi:chemotaxis-specific protein-glutamate methyltransferase CheB [Chitiniphilus purpureus]|uniref:Protein-glutamate methylesterase/protein-glutamine glutaminase n=1 Tax=Chitiniphilus purpureus TaxID=2981137 RepID=A0ABY6DHX6_9NEIS|nr:chemotaxis-specific protein-glutamate methyltransferase CheB [Chitiniphilus sp. CD1]UXY13955.1 chemotaxis-specific protein-glutamate methyltransferase CheB [Chitiniphilus sp. CD1]
MSTSSERAGKCIRVLIVDDSAAYRGLLGKLLARHPQFILVGEAASAAEARAAIKALHPDVLTLDVEMPGMSGLVFLEHLMRLHPLPVVMVSAAARQNADVILSAMALGAVDFVLKPDGADAAVLAEFERRLVATLRVAAFAQPRRAAVSPLPAALACPARPDRLIAVGASTGGTEAIRALLCGLGAHSPPVLVVQHLPDSFVPAFIDRLDRACALRVRAAVEDEVLRPGHVYLSPGDVHLAVARQDGQLVVRLLDCDRVNFHRPAVDVLFQSVACTAAPCAIGVLLTGMGKDGAAGLAAIRTGGGYAIAQSERSCVVFGMPREAILLDAVDAILDLQDIPAALAQLIAAPG